MFIALICWTLTVGAVAYFWCRRLMGIWPPLPFLLGWSAVFLSGGWLPIYMWFVFAPVVFIAAAGTAYFMVASKRGVDSLEFAHVFACMFPFHLICIGAIPHVHFFLALFRKYEMTYFLMLAFAPTVIAFGYWLRQRCTNMLPES